MHYGICGLSLVPMRSDPSDKSEMISQLLFGETCAILENSAQWARIRCTYDNYEGWVDGQQILIISAATFETLRNTRPSCSLDLVYSATSKNRHIPLLLGSSLPFFDGINFKLKSERFVYNGQVRDGSAPPLNAGQLIKVALKYLGAPYLWGGKSPFGTDCSGFVQIVYKIAGMSLARDAWQQAAAGITVDFTHQARAADLAFFDNNEGQITHVGIIMDNQKIIHASGFVRIDPIDSYGIYRADKKTYSHKLRIIKRILP